MESLDSSQHDGIVAEKRVCEELSVPPTHRLIYTQVKQVVAVCKMVAWLRYATRDMPRARFYGRFEDDHFVAMKLIAADLRGLGRPDGAGSDDGGKTTNK